MRVGLLLPLGDEPIPGVPGSFAEINALALEVEQAGLDSVWLYDHLLMQLGDDPAAASWEAWTLMSALAATTRRVQLGALVSCNSFRHPALLARMAHTVAEISGDRLILGVGAGWHEPEYRAFGFPFDHRVDRFEEAIEIIAAMVREGKATLNGKYYQVEDCPQLPPRPDAPTMPIMIGARGDRMLGLVAKWADSWNTAWYARPDERYAETVGRLRAACEAQGRDPASIEVTVGMLVGSGERHTPREAQAVADALAAWRDEGVGHVICWPDPSDKAGVDALTEGVARFRS
jgi:alkanesulfonate monooxygenase SsuD/methylene tetrahydromethanopterin reductase-like flavin-dependent oxidoreductase (luciferase family)